MPVPQITYHNSYLQVTGELTFLTVPFILEEARPLIAAAPVLKFDLQGVTICNSAGLALLLEWLKYAKQTKKNIEFFYLPKNLLLIAAAAGIDNLLQKSY